MLHLLPKAIVLLLQHGLAGAYRCLELIPVNVLTMIAHDELTQSLCIKFLGERHDKTIHEGGVEDLGEETPKLGNRLIHRERKVLRLRPGYGAASLDNQERIGGQITEAQGLVRFKCGMRADEYLIKSRVRLTGRHSRRRVDLRHAGEQLLVMRAVPGFV